MSYMSIRPRSEFLHSKTIYFIATLKKCKRNTNQRQGEGETLKTPNQKIMHNSELEVLALANWTDTGISPVVYSEFPRVKEDSLLKMTP